MYQFSWNFYSYMRRESIYIYMYIYIYICIENYLLSYTSLFLSSNPIFIISRINLYINIHLFTYIYIYAFICEIMKRLWRRGIKIYIYIHIHIHIYILTYLLSCKSLFLSSNPIFIISRIKAPAWMR
jgi:hypothetical protein